MAFDHELAARIRKAIGKRRGIEEKTMFGGLGFLLHGNMCVGVWQDSLLARVGPDAYETSLREPFVAEFDITGRPMRGWILVSAAGVAAPTDVRRWVELSLEYVADLPPKSK